MSEQAVNPDQAPVSADNRLAGADSSCLDPQAIARLRELDPQGRQGVVERVLRAYEASLANHLVDIVRAGDGGGPQLLARTVHTLKSSSAAVGALALAQRCAEIEQLARVEGRMPEPAVLQALVAQGRAVRAAVADMLAE